MAKLVTFFIMSWLLTNMIAASIQGGGGIVSTTLTEDLTADDETISVNSTEGFYEHGDIITIGDEQIRYYDVTGTTFKGTLASDLVRGYNDTEATAHSNGELIYTVPASRMNAAMNYFISSFTDSSGLWVAITVPIAFLQIIGTFFTLPLSFLGTKMQFLTYIWAALAIGGIVSLWASMAGSRRAS
jgi:hypothetical protein